MFSGVFYILIWASLGHGYEDVIGWETMERIRDRFPYCRIGQDYDGAGVYFIPVAAWNFGELTAYGTPGEKEELELHVDEMFQGLTEDSGRSHEGATFIVDYGGVNMADVLSIDAFRISIKMLGSNSHFSRGVKRVVIVNSGMMAQFFVTVWRPLLGDIMSRTEVYGSDSDEWVPQILRTVPSDLLPQGYGGANPMPEKCDRMETRRQFVYPTPETVRSAMSFVGQNGLELVSAGVVGGFSRALGNAQSAFGNFFG